MTTTKGKLNFKIMYYYINSCQMAKWLKVNGYITVLKQIVNIVLIEFLIESQLIMDKKNQSS